MLKKLKRKFIVMTMALISVVLITMLAVQLISTWNQRLNAINMSLDQAIASDYISGRQRERFGSGARDDLFLNTVTVLTDGECNVLYSDLSSVEMSDEDLAAAVSGALASDAERGRIAGLGLYYRRSGFTWKSIHDRARANDHEQLGDRTAEGGQLPPLPSGERLPEEPRQGEARGDDPAMLLMQNAELYELLSGLEDGTQLYKIAFVSESSLVTAFNSQLITSLAVGGAALIVLFLICLYLAGWALRPVEAVWAQQRRFISDASHELKTPLTVILANLDIMRRHGADTVDAQRQWLDSTDDEARRMKKLVEDLLTLARLDEAGQTAPEIELADVDLSDIALGAALTFETVAFENGMALETDIAPEIAVRGDGNRLRQLVTILLDNAVKYAGPHGRIDVRLSAQKDRATLSVANTGDPIDPESLAHLFDRFYRADEARTGAKAGYGLGLSIAQSIARHHGGELTAASDAANGTVFTFTIPRKQA